MVNHRRLITITALLATLAACATAPPQAPPFIAGQRIPAPAGWVEYCRATPADSACSAGANPEGRP